MSQANSPSQPDASTTPSKPMTPKRFVLSVLICVLILSGLGIAGYSQYKAMQAKNLAKPERARAAGRPLPVRTDHAKEEEYERVIGAVAITEPSRMAVVRYAGASDPSGQSLMMVDVLAKEGQKVEKGEVLFSVGEDTLKLVYDQAIAVEKAAQAEYDGVKRLHARKAASQYELSAASIRLDSAKLDSKIAHKNLLASSVKSPIDGHLDLINAVAGESVDSSTELTTVYCLDPIHVRVDVPQERVVDIHQDAEAEVVIDSFPHDTFKGKVISVSPQVDPETRVLSAVIRVPNPEEKIKAGMSGFARFRQKEASVVVPDTAVVILNGKASVFVVKDQRAALQSVRTGALVDTGVRVVEAGLSPGDEIVVYGQQDLRDNDLVDTDWKEWTRRETSKTPLAQSEVSTKNPKYP